jgi:hypothetical protein
MDEVIQKDKVNCFKIKIINTNNSAIILGIVDRLTGKNNTDSHGQNYAIYYDCRDGSVYPQNLGIKGVKVINGETISIIGDLSKGKVEFKVNGIIQATVNDYKILTENNR